MDWIKTPASLDLDFDLSKISYASKIFFPIYQPIILHLIFNIKP